MGNDTGMFAFLRYGMTVKFYRHNVYLTYNEKVSRNSRALREAFDFDRISLFRGEREVNHSVNYDSILV
jgi:hypothetical protein